MVYYVTFHIERVLLFFFLIRSTFSFLLNHNNEEGVENSRLLNLQYQQQDDEVVFRKQLWMHLKKLTSDEPISQERFLLQTLTTPPSLKIERGQIIQLINPLGFSKHINTASHQFIKFKAAFIQGDRPFNNEKKPSFDPDLPKKKLSNTHNKQNELVMRGKTAQQLSESSCLGIASKTASLSGLDGLRLPKTCAEAFINHWTMNFSRHQDTIEETSSNNNSDILNDDVTMGSTKMLNTVVCHGEWIPRGGQFGDVISDALLPFNEFSDSVVFSFPSDLLTQILNISQEDVKKQIKSHGVAARNSSRARNSSSGQQQSRHEDAFRSNSGSQVVSDTTTTALFQLCHYPSILPHARIVPREVGVIDFINPPILFASPQYLRVPVRIFLNPGWSLDISIFGVNFTQSANLISLKLGNCNGFYDTLSFKATRAFDIVSEDQATSKLENDASNGDPEGRQGQNLIHHQSYNNNMSEAIFHFEVNYKEETSELPTWHTKFVDPSSYKKNASNNNKSSVLTPSMMTKDSLRSLGGGSSIPSDTIAAFQICYYASDQQFIGTNLGSVSFFSDYQDSAELVGFIIFALIGVPFVCGLTLSCYSYKHRKLRKKLRRMRLVQQRDEIEKRLLDHLGMDRVDSDNSDSEDEKPQLETSRSLEVVA